MSDKPNLPSKPQITPLTLKPDLLRSLSQENSQNAPPSPERYPTFDYQQFLAFRQPGDSIFSPRSPRGNLLGGLQLSPRDFPQVSPKSMDMEHGTFGNPQNIFDKSPPEPQIEKRPIKQKEIEIKQLPTMQSMQQRQPLPNIVQMTQGPPIPQYQQRTSENYMPPMYSRPNVQFTQPVMKPSIQVLPQDIKNMLPNQFKKDHSIKLPELQQYDLQQHGHQQIQHQQMPQQQQHMSQQMPQQMNVQQNMYPNMMGQGNSQNPQIYPYSGQKPMQKEIFKQILSKKKRYGFDPQQQQQVPQGQVQAQPNTSPAQKRDREEALDNSAKKQKHFLSSTSVQLLKEWFYDHLDHPYPSADQKEDLSKKTGLTYLQVSNWFTNTRKRVWAPSMRTLMQKGGEGEGEDEIPDTQQTQPQPQTQQTNDQQQQQPQVPPLPLNQPQLQKQQPIMLPLSPDSTSQGQVPSQVGMPDTKLEPFEGNWEQK